MRSRPFIILSGSLLLLLLVGNVTQTSAQSTTQYSANVTPSPFVTPVLKWGITNVTERAVGWGWGGDLFWQAQAHQQVIFEVQELRDDELHGVFTIGNLTLPTNDSRIAGELMFSIWPWFTGLVSHLDWETVDQAAIDSATGWMEGDMEIRTSATTKTYIYHQGSFGNQNTTLVYDINTGVLRAAYSEFFFAEDYHLGLQLVEAALYLTPITFVVLVGIGFIVLLVIIIVRRRK
jgi:hypothetical protein